MSDSSGANIDYKVKTRKTRQPLFLTLNEDQNYDPQVPLTRRFNVTTANLNEQQQTTIVKEEEILKEFPEARTRQLLTFESAYKPIDYWRMSDVYRSEGSIARAIDTLAQFILGEYTKLVLDANGHYSNDEDRSAAVDEINNNDDYNEIVSDLERICKRVDLNTHLSNAIKNRKIFGRAATYIEVNDAGIPYALKTLSSQRIGKVFAWGDDYTFAGLEYMDFPAGEQIVKADKLLYWVNKNSHTVPRTLWNGLSDIECVLDIAETSIINKQTNVKEINRKQWSALMIIKMFTKNKAIMARFKKQFQAGKTVLTNQDIDVAVHAFTNSLDQILQQMDTNDRKIARDLELPLLLMGFEDTQNRSTADAVLYSWTQSKLQYERTMVRDVVEKGFINPSIKAIIKIKGGIQSLGNLQQYTESYDITSKNYIPRPTFDTSVSNSQNQNQPTNIDNPVNTPFNIDDLVVDMLPFEVKLSFVSITLDSFLDKSAAVIGLKTAGIIDEFAMALELLGLQKYIPGMRIYAEQKAQFQAEQFQQQQDAYMQMSQAEAKIKGQGQQGQTPAQAKLAQAKAQSGAFGAPGASSANYIKGLPQVSDRIKKATISSQRSRSGGGGGGNKYLKI